MGRRKVWLPPLRANGKGKRRNVIHEMRMKSTCSTSKTSWFLGSDISTVEGRKWWELLWFTEFTSGLDCFLWLIQYSINCAAIWCSFWGANISCKKFWLPFFNAWQLAHHYSQPGSILTSAHWALQSLMLFISSLDMYVHYHTFFPHQQLVCLEQTFFSTHFFSAPEVLLQEWGH